MLPAMFDGNFPGAAEKIRRKKHTPDTCASRTYHIFFKELMSRHFVDHSNPKSRPP